MKRVTCVRYYFMRIFAVCSLSLSALLLFTGTVRLKKEWHCKKRQRYNICFTGADKKNIVEYNSFLEKGITDVNIFFDSTFRKKFDVYVHPTRHSLDSTWQTNWKMPSFKSECWMVASGVADRLDMISPKTWSKTACEHRYEEKENTQRLITHELVHVYHGQVNASPDFSNTERVDWFVEGLATYASGQLDSMRVKEIKTVIAADKTPKSLDQFWTGRLRYGLSGSVVMYIDKKYGRNKLKELLPLNKKTELLAVLKISETELLDQWKQYMLGM